MIPTFREIHSADQQVLTEDRQTDTPADWRSHENAVLILRKEGRLTKPVGCNKRLLTVPCGSGKGSRGFHLRLRRRITIITITTMLDTFRRAVSLPFYGRRKEIWPKQTREKLERSCLASAKKTTRDWHQEWNQKSSPFVERNVGQLRPIVAPNRSYFRSTETNGSCNVQK